MGFDESELDDAALIESRDEGRLLWALATAGAQVRRAVELSGDAGVATLRGERPRSVLIATDAPSASVARTLERMVAPAAPVVIWGGPELPRWAGPTDALLVGTVDGRHPRIASLLAQANQRGLSVALAAPAGSPVVAAAGRAAVAELPLDVKQRASRWSVLTPLLVAAEALGLVDVPTGLLAEVAQALDETAEACRPSGDAFTNPAKALAVEFSSTTPVLAGAGALASVAARVGADVLQLFAGVSATYVTLPDGVARAGAILSRRLAPRDIFADDGDADDGPNRPRLLVIGDDGEPDDPLLGERTTTQIQLDEVAARRAAKALHDIARGNRLRSSSVDVPHGAALSRFAAATAFCDYTAAYLALGLGIDPSAPRAGELAH